MANILVQKDANNLIPKLGISTTERAAWAVNYTIYDINADGSRSAAYGPTSPALADEALAPDTTAQFRRTDAAALQALVSGGGIAGMTPAGRPSFVSRPAGGAIQSSSTVQTQTEGLLMCSPVPYYALRISYTHLGGNGPVTGFKALFASSDDGGSRDMTSVSDAALKKMVTPKRGGTSYNTIVTDGSPGWVAVTWEGAASVNIADPGAGKLTTVTSDMAYVLGVVDANGLYPLLVRYFYGSASITIAPFLAGQAVGTNLATDMQGAYVVALNRGGTDAVATPSLWGDANGPNPSASVANLTVEFFTADSVMSVHCIGDSRFGVSAETSGTRQYLSFEAALQNALVALGRKASVIRAGISGSTSATYQSYGLSQYNMPVARWVVYLIYTVNDGAPTDATVGLALARAADVLRLARAAGQRVLFIPAFPNGATYTAPQLAKFGVITAWAQACGDAAFDALAVYGNESDGSWRSGYAYDASHMLNSGYRDMAQRIALMLT